MENLNNIKRVCGFYISSVHLITMTLPYIREQLDNKVEFKTFFEYNLNENINEIFKKIIINNETKQKILNINWKNTKIQKYSNIEKFLKNIIENNKEINLLISGSKKYIEETNKMLDKFFEKHSQKVMNKYITIINCYEAMEFNDDVREILNIHKYILNTSGMHNVEDVFEDYKNKIVN